MKMYGMRYQFKGTDTSKRLKYAAEADTAIGLYNDLVNQGVISIADSNPYDEALLEKFNLTWNDFTNEDEELDYEKFTEWQNAEHSLTEDEVLTLIGYQDGNAYYQTIIDLTKIRYFCLADSQQDILEENIESDNEEWLLAQNEIKASEIGKYNSGYVLYQYDEHNDKFDII